MAERDPPAASDVVGEDACVRDEGTPTIFVADDDDVFRRVLGLTLREQGYRVIEVSNGAAAMEALAAAADGFGPMPDLVVLDVCMPEYSGLGVLGLLRRLHRRPPTFLVTGFEDASIDQVGERRGATCVFHKPIDLEVLVTAIHDALGGPPLVGASERGPIAP